MPVVDALDVAFDLVLDSLRHSDGCCCETSHEAVSWARAYKCFLPRRKERVSCALKAMTSLTSGPGPVSSRQDSTLLAAAASVTAPPRCAFLLRQYFLLRYGLCAQISLVENQPSCLGPGSSPGVWFLRLADRRRTARKNPNASERVRLSFDLFSRSIYATLRPLLGATQVSTFMAIPYQRSAL